MAEVNILAMVLAGGEGSRLHPLTADRSKPAVPFGGRYRIVDFVIGNLVNSNILSIYLLVQYKSQSLIEHLRRSWELSPVVLGHFFTEVPPQKESGDDWFRGTANAVYQNLKLIERHQPELVVVFGADHIYRMDIRQMVEFHRSRDAEATVAARPVPVEEASAFGIIEADSDGRIRGFQEKPENPKSMPHNSACAYASMGNYLFNTPVLRKVLEESQRRGEHDFGKEVLPNMLETHRLFAYDFATNQVPGAKPYEEPAYWRDVGTIEAYWKAHQDIIGPKPRFDLFCSRWPIRSYRYDGPAANIVGGEIHNSIIGAGSSIRSAKLLNSIIGQEVVLEDDVELDECIILGYAKIGRGSRLRRVIVDRHNVIEAGSRIGFDREIDGQRYYVDSSGITVVPKGERSLRRVY